MPAPSSGNIAPRQSTGEFNAQPSLLSTLQEGVKRIQFIEMTFAKIDELHEDLSERAVNKRAVENTYFDIVRLGITRDNVRKTIEEGAEAHGGGDITTLGYTAMMSAGRDTFLERMAETWAAKPEVEAFMGKEVIVSPRGIWRRELPIAGFNCDGICASLEAGNWVRGRITGISPLESGTISLEDGESSYMVGNHERTVDPYSRGSVNRIFVDPGDHHITPSVEIQPIADLALRA